MGRGFMPSILDLFTCEPGCPICKGTGTVCENHMDQPWGEFAAGGCSCGAGAPCPGPRLPLGGPGKCVIASCDEPVIVMSKTNDDRDLYLCNKHGLEWYDACTSDGES